MDLDEYTDQQILNEMERRKEKRKLGLCAYCWRPPSAPTCRYREQHHHPDIVKQEDRDV